MAAILAVMVFAAGCTQIPTSGPVEEVPMSAEPRGVDLAPQPPEEGVQPARLIEGFLQAMASPEGGYAIARRYLTEAAAARWDPTSAAVVDALVVGLSDGTVEGVQVGVLDGNGRFAAVPQEFEHDFRTVQEKGQWRIASPPAGLLLSRYIFERYYERVPLYFTSRSGTHVVPDPIHVPEMVVTPTAIVEALLSGPSEAIAPAVADAVPSGVHLADGGATIDSAGVVTVQLTGLYDRLSDDARRRLGAQLLWSLTAVPRVTGLVVTNDGIPFTLPGARADGVVELAGQQGYQILSRASTVDLFGVRDGAPGRVLGDDRFEPWRGVEAAVADLAVSLDGDSAALIDEGRTGLLMGTIQGEMTPVEVPYVNLRSPQFVLGTLWLLGEDAEGSTRLFTVNRMGDVEEATVQIPDGRGLEQFAVSPTRARVSLLLSAGGVREVGMATVLPGGPLTVVEWRPLPLVAPSGQILTDPSAVAWHGETSVAVAGVAAGLRSVYSAEVDGSLVEELGPLSGEVEELTAMARLGGGAVAIRNSAGVTWRYEARTRWTRLAEDLTAIAYAS